MGRHGSQDLVSLWVDASCAHGRPGHKAEAQRDELRDAAKDALYESVNSTTYPDGPNLDKDTRDALRAAIEKATPKGQNVDVTT